jgi:hypothetical protein
LGFKIDSYSLVIWKSKLPRWFLGLILKIKRALVCQLHHKTDGRVGARHTLRSSGLLRVEISFVRVSQSDMKTDEDATMGGARGTIVKVASESS